MLRSLLTPFRARFDQQPASPAVNVTGDEEDLLAPEDFARDVLIELMRNSVDSLKAADSIHAQTEVSGGSVNYRALPTRRADLDRNSANYATRFLCQARLPGT
jgi:hypothetical protein